MRQRGPSAPNVASAPPAHHVGRSGSGVRRPNPTGGARVAYVVNHLGSFDSPLEWVQIWNGGISLWPVLDGVAPGLALGITIGRLGDLVVADHLGKPTRFVLGSVCPTADTASPCAAPVGKAVHQPALYDLIAALAILALLLTIRARRRAYGGFLALLFGALYGTARLVEDFFRVDETHGTGLTGSQWAALTVAALSTWWLFTRRRTPGRKVDEPERVPMGSEQGAAP